MQATGIYRMYINAVSKVDESWRRGIIKDDDFFFFNDTATTEIYTLSLHDALPISWPSWEWCARRRRRPRPPPLLNYPPLADPRRDFPCALGEIGRAHVWTPVTRSPCMPSSAWKKKLNVLKIYSQSVWTDTMKWLNIKYLNHDNYTNAASTYENREKIQGFLLSKQP